MVNDAVGIALLCGWNRVFRIERDPLEIIREAYDFCIYLSNNKGILVILSFQEVLFPHLSKETGTNNIFEKHFRSLEKIFCDDVQNHLRSVFNFIKKAAYFCIIFQIKYFKLEHKNSFGITIENNVCHPELKD